MSVLLDTSVLSLALRRHRAPSDHRDQVARLLRSGNAVLLGVVRQEVLSGIRDPATFAVLRDQLRALPDHLISMTHHELAAEYFNTCRRRGVQGTLVDLLICAVASIDGLSIYTTDRDFERFSELLGVRLFRTPA